MMNKKFLGLCGGALCSLFLLSGCKKYVDAIHPGYQELCVDKNECIDRAAFSNYVDAYDRGQTRAHADIVVLNAYARSLIHDVWGSCDCSSCGQNHVLLLWGPQDRTNALLVKDDNGRNCSNWVIQWIVDGVAYSDLSLTRVDPLRPYHEWLFAERFNRYRDLYDIQLSTSMLDIIQKAHTCRGMRFIWGEFSFDVDLSDIVFD